MTAKIIKVFLLFFLILAAFSYSKTTYAVQLNAQGSAPAGSTQTCPATGCALDASNFNYLINGQTTIEGSFGQELFCGLLSWSPLNPFCAGYQLQVPIPNPSHSMLPTTKLMVYNQLPNGGALGMLSSAMVAMYTSPPTSATMYLADLGQNIGIIPQNAYAQSIGGAGDGIIRPILNLWTTVRNITYLFFVVIFIIVGLMIMFRQNIGGHGAHLEVTVQQALPGLVVGLILVTFSYFISALLVDTTFVGTDLVIGLFSTSAMPNTFDTLGDCDTSSPPVCSAPALQKSYRNFAQNAGLLEMIRATGLNPDTLSKVYTGTIGQGINLVGGDALQNALTGIPAFLIKAFIVLPGGVVLSTLVVLILLIALIVQMFRLVLALLVAYIEILVLTIISPIFILVGSIPGRGEMITGWWKGILGNALIFPAVFAVFLFAGMIIGSSDPLDVRFPLVGNLNGNFLKIVLGYVIILGTPSIPGMVKKALGVEGLGNMAQVGIGGFAAVGGFATGASARSIGSAYRSHRGIQNPQTPTHRAVRAIGNVFGIHGWGAHQTTDRQH